MINRRIRSTRQIHRQGNPWKVAIFFSLASVIILIFLFFYGVSFLIKLSLALQSLNRLDPVPAQIGKNDTRVTAPGLYPPPIATNSGKIDIQGLAQPGQPIRLYLNQEKYGDILSDASGKFVFFNVELQAGDNQIYATSISADGPEEISSNNFNILYQKKPPEIEILQPQDGSSFNGESEKNIYIKGKTTPDNSVMINDHLIVVQPNGEFSAPYELADGDNLLKITVKDLAGNETAQDLKLIYHP